MISRRKFLQTSSVVSLSPMLPCIFSSTAAAGPAQDERVLVVVQLDGGNDGLNTVVPFADDNYGKVRNKLRLERKRLHNLNDSLGLHPGMPAAKELYEDGRLTIVQGVGYPNPNRSHFRSMKIWQTAEFDEDAHDGYGWLGRTLDLQLQQIQRSSGANAIFVGEQETPVALWGRRSSAHALSRADDLILEMEVPAGGLRSDAAHEANGLRQFVTQQFLTAYAASDLFKRRKLTDSSGSDGKYPDTGLASRLKLVSKLIKGDSRARVFYTIQSGYDTHSAQLYTHYTLLREFADAVKAFLDDLKAAKLDDRVILLAFSEFGRRVKENDSEGTDHGTAGPVFLAGPSLVPSLVGKGPNLNDLDDGDLKMQIDFRSVYAAILDDWLGVDSRKVLGGTFKRLPLIKA